MPLNLDKVHVYTMVGGQETLTGTNFYRRFERRAGDKRTDPIHVYIAQGGEWYDQGGHPIPADKIPEWVWEECRAMAPYDRGMYRIVLPEEAAKGMKVPTFEESEEYPPNNVVIQAVLSLDGKNDKHWTKDGLPSLETLAERLGARVTRKRLEMILPNFVRPAS